MAHYGLVSVRSDNDCYCVLTLKRVSFNKVNYPSHRHLRQQTHDTVSHVLLFLVRCNGYNPGANRTGLPKLDEEAVKVPPLPKYLFSNGVLNICAGVCQVVRCMNRNLSKGLMFGWDGLE